MDLLGLVGQESLTQDGEGFQGAELDRPGQAFLLVQELGDDLGRLGLVIGAGAPAILLDLLDPFDRPEFHPERLLRIGDFLLEGRERILLPLSPRTIMA